MKYLFILGRNQELSIAEIKSYLKRTNREFEEIGLNKNAILINIDYELADNEIDFLGGTLAIGEVICSGDEKRFEKEIEKTMIYTGTKNNFNYTVWDFSEKFEDFREYLKKRFREEKLKASFKGLTNEINMQEGENELIPSSRTIDEEYFIFENKEINYFGRIIQKCDYKTLSNRDMKKPIRRESLAISPRLAKIMINLSEVRTGEKLLDAFCGIGVILQEALLQNLEVLGVDRDKKAIEGAKENLEWFKFNSKKYSLVNYDSTRVDLRNFEVMVCEPDLGEILKKIPTKEKAENILRNFEKLIVQVINNVKRKVSGKIVFTSPYIRIGKKRIACDIDNICTRTGYKIILGIPEYRENQIVGRMIYVLEKN